MATISHQLEEYQKSLEDYNKTLAELTDLITALDNHTGKVVNQTFFDKYFHVDSEHGGYTKYNIYRSKYAWGKPYSIRVNRTDYGLDSRETEHVKAVLIDHKTNLTEGMKNKEKEIQALQGVDEGAIKKDLIAVFNKYGIDERTWFKILESYDIRYPKK